MCFPRVYSFLSSLSIPEKKIHLLISNPITSAVKENEISKQMDSRIAVPRGTGIPSLIIHSFIMARWLTLNHELCVAVNFWCLSIQLSLFPHYYLKDISKIFFSIYFLCNDFVLNPAKLLFFQSTAMHSTT